LVKEDKAGLSIRIELSAYMMKEGPV
jgi:hypothetical protein